MLYFAYGSNMDWQRMRKRCPGAQFLFKATLPGYKLAFTHFSTTNNCGAADVVHSPTETVWGVVYHLEQTDLPGLHRAEGYEPGRARNAYAPSTVVVHPDGDQQRKLSVTTFTVCHKLPAHQKPSREYLSHLLNGATNRGLPGEYIEQLKRFEKMR